MLEDINEVRVTGRLGGDGDLRYTGNGQAVCNFSVAVTRIYRRRDGLQEATDWFRVTAWGDVAKVGGGLVKGQRVEVHGRLETGKYDDREGVTRYTVQIIASELRAGERPVTVNANGKEPVAVVSLDETADSMPF
jgi:single-strand DNA-binding protein